jgi:hypothetical protein
VLDRAQPSRILYSSWQQSRPSDCEEAPMRLRPVRLAVVSDEDD